MLYKEYFAKGMGLDLIQYENRLGNGLLVCVGSGLLMATMDEILTIKDAIEIFPKQRTDKVINLFPALASFYDYIFLHCWFSISTPDFYNKIVTNLPKNKVYWKSNIPLNNGVEFESMVYASEFLNNFKLNNSEKV